MGLRHLNSPLYTEIVVSAERRVLGDLKGGMAATPPCLRARQSRPCAQNRLARPRPADFWLSLRRPIDGDFIAVLVPVFMDEEELIDACARRAVGRRSAKLAGRDGRGLRFANDGARPSGSSTHAPRRAPRKRRNHFDGP